MDDTFSPLDFVEGWTRRSTAVSSRSRDGLSAVLTRSFETIGSILNPHSNPLNVERHLATLQHECNLTMEYDPLYNNRTMNTRLFTYGLVQSLHATLAELQLNRRPLPNPPSQAIHNGDSNIPMPIFRHPIAPLPVITVEPDDFMDTRGRPEQNQSLMLFNTNNNQRGRLTNNHRNARNSSSFTSAAAPVSSSDESVEVKPVIAKRGRGRPKKIKREVDAEEMNDTSLANSMRFVPIRSKKSYIAKNTMAFKRFDQERRKMELALPSGSMKVKGEVMKGVNVKVEPLEGIVEGVDCFVCRMTLKRHLRGFTDHLAKEHRITLRDSGYKIVCGCGEVMKTTGHARMHNTECGMVNYTVEREE